MDSDRLNRWLTLGANLGVLVGIILLIVELEQNREMMRAQTRNEISAEIVDLLSHVATEPQLASLLRRADEGGEDLTPDEFFQYDARLAAMIRYFENVHYQYRLGLYDEAEYAAHRESWRAYFAFGKMRAKTWCEYREISSAEFAAEIDSLIPPNSC